MNFARHVGHVYGVLRGRHARRRDEHEAHQKGPDTVASKLSRLIKFN